MAETIVINIAYALYVASGFIKTLFRLRIALIGVSIAFVIWGVVSEVWAAVPWNIAFGAVHAYELFRMWREERAITLTEVEAGIHQRLFPDLDLMEFFTMWSVGTSRPLTVGTELITENKPQRTLALIVEGELEVTRAEEYLATLRPDHLVGERRYLPGEPANATVRAVGEATVHEWDQKKMAALVDLCPPAHKSMTRLIGADLARKL
ncbi:MAG: cyclic nucleotide-binding domain-containing protein [Actinomycetota bacterium]